MPDEAGLALIGSVNRGAPAHGATVTFIVERLRDDILARRLPPGTRLVEIDLTARFAVSRGPVREALRRLAAEGLIEHVPHSRLKPVCAWRFPEPGFIKVA